MIDFIAISGHECHAFKASDESAARDWVSAHLDKTQEWQIDPAGSHFMAPHTGIVQTLASWLRDGFNLENTLLVAVQLNESGQWDMGQNEAPEADTSTDWLSARGPSDRLH